MRLIAFRKRGRPFSSGEHSLTVRAEERSVGCVQFTPMDAPHPGSTVAGEFPQRIELHVGRDKLKAVVLGRKLAGQNFQRDLRQEARQQEIVRHCGIGNVDLPVAMILNVVRPRPR